ncbi:helix-turn-helix domain-containing protein [Rhodococcus globerulus]|uniref:Helix-turn-helix transcriptional regulator n=1 Tax=Rhodococcus globerulus TaxID=33008 RepID=A0ABU4BSI6_RHOGO|nr:helix-turn-helix transcriptional regulator [Rhodococcus globerulus]MDV6267026.1 helix-turn-helix transcriptional regulator [Rhodococcus globerulus]
MTSTVRRNGAAPMNENTRRAYGPQIRAIRTAIGWSRDKLSSESDVPLSTLKGIENGAAGQQENLDKIFGTLGVVPSDYGLITHEIRDMLGVFAPLVARIPPDKLPETMAVIMRILSRVGQGLPIPELVIDSSVPTIGAEQVNLTLGDAEITQTKVTPQSEAEGT